MLYRKQPRSQGPLLPFPWSERKRDPGKRWSRVSQNLRDEKTQHRGRDWQVISNGENLRKKIPAPPSMLCFVVSQIPGDT